MASGVVVLLRPLDKVEPGLQGVLPYIVANLLPEGCLAAVQILTLRALNAANGALQGLLVPSSLDGLEVLLQVIPLYVCHGAVSCVATSSPSKVLVSGHARSSHRQR
eukprot:scaffold527_cov368-Prasinococcus_capsulatus_cf.AAC.18